MVKDSDIDPGVVAFFRAPCEGYGPLEGNSLPTGIIRYGKNSDNSTLGSRKLTEIRRSSQIWLIGDVGYPKGAMSLTQIYSSVQRCRSVREANRKLRSWQLLSSNHR